MDSTIEVQGRQLKLSNLEKVLYPAAGFTKQQIIDYYVRIAPAMLPHLQGRALTRKRYPNGVDAEYFYEKNAPQHRPDWVKTAPIWSEGNHRTVHYILANDLATLVWLANLAAIELHPSLALAKDITCPTMMVFDLDPGPPANIVQCCQVAFWLREIFEKFGLKSFPKTSGSKGLQVYVPLNTPTTYDETKSFRPALAQLLEHEHPQMVVSDMKKICAPAKCLSTGARTMSTRLRLRFIRCARESGPRFRLRFPGRKWRRLLRKKMRAFWCLKRSRPWLELRSWAICSPRCWS